jgi:hypothetical protein
MPCGEGVDHLIEESWRQKTVMITITAADFPKIIARPIEFIALCNDDPRTLVIETEMTLYRGGNFNCTCGISWRCMGDRQNHNDSCVIRRAIDCKDDHAWAIFAPFFLTRFVFVVPQIGVRYHKARLRRGDRHAPVLFRLKHGIEMRMPLVHA